MNNNYCAQKLAYVVGIFHALEWEMTQFCLRQVTH